MLKQHGFAPKHIIDVGANREIWTRAAIKFFPDAHCTLAGIITTVAGNGNCNYTGDGDFATSATPFPPDSVTLDGSGNLFIVDHGNDVTRRVDAGTKIITTYAGTGGVGYAGDNGQASLAALYFPLAIAADANGNLYGRSRKRKCELGDLSRKRTTLMTGKSRLRLPGPIPESFPQEENPGNSATCSAPCERRT